jgi:hypothetical protein
MFTSTVFTAVLASSAVLLSNAIVTPNAPGPGDSFNQGTKCSLSWAGDTVSTTAWANMAIELMTGKNEAMVHVTSQLYFAPAPICHLTIRIAVATGQDGTKEGSFSYDCPEVGQLNSRRRM